MAKRAKNPAVKIEIDKTGPLIHVTIPEYNGWIKMFMNDQKLGPGVFRVVDGMISIQLSGALPNEYRFRAEVLNKNSKH